MSAGNCGQCGELVALAAGILRPHQRRVYDSLGDFSHREACPGSHLTQSAAMALEPESEDDE